MIADRNDEVILKRARRVGLRRSPFYTYLTWMTFIALACAAVASILAGPGGASDTAVLPGVLYGVFFVGAATDLLLAWYLARRWGVARLLKARTRAAEEAADRRDHRAVLDALDPVKRFWGSEEFFLTARSRIALKKAGEL